MPMRQHLQGHGFDPETARLLGLAFEMALVALQHADRVVGTRNTVYGLLKLRAMDHSHFRLARRNEV